MEELRDTSIHHTAIKISNDIKNMNVYDTLYKMVQVSDINPIIAKLLLLL